MNRQPQLMDRSQMQHILAPDLQKIRQQVYFDNELGIVHGAKSHLLPSMITVWASS